MGAIVFTFIANALKFGLPPLIDKTVDKPVFIISREDFCTTLKLLQPPAEQVVYSFSKVPFFRSTKNSSMENVNAK